VEHFWGFHAGGVGLKQRKQSRSEFEDFSFYAEEFAPFPREKIYAEGRNERPSNPW
jgi:hypothetical protein